MEAQAEGRSARKRKAILEAATTSFLSKGYLETSMEDVAKLAAVSKQTVYKHFADKQTLFAEIVLATTGSIEVMVRLAAELPVTDPADLEPALHDLASSFLTALLQPQVLQLRRLVIANAERFPDLSRSWYEQGFERVLATLAVTFRRLAGQGLLRVDDPLLAADHFAGLLLWIPVNRAMFKGADQYTDSELQEYATAAARTFIAAYGAPVE